MNRIELSKDEFNFIYTNCRNAQLTQCTAEWDGYGGLDWDFCEAKLDEDSREQIIEILEQIREELDIIWNFKLAFYIRNEKSVEIILTEIRNVDFYDSVVINDSDLIQDDLKKYILDTYDIDISKYEPLIILNQSGSSEGNVAVENFEFTVTKDGKDIDLADEESENYISESVHQFILKEYPIDFVGSTYDYEIEYEDGLNYLNLTLASITITIEPDEL